MKFLYLRLCAVAVIVSAACIGIKQGAFAGVASLIAGAQAITWTANSRRHCFGAYTAVSDVVVPAVFLPYVVERTAELSELVTAGIIDNDEQFATLAGQGGKTVDMPFWQDLAGDDQVIDDVNPLTTKKITASRDVAIISERGDAWKTNDLAKYLSGSDPMRVIGDLVADYWARKTQAMTISLLTGVFKIASMAGNLLALHATAGAVDDTANTLNGRTFIQAVQKLGDAKSMLTAVIMHSAVEADLATRDLIDFVPDSQGNLTIRTFMGKRVIVDDGMPVETINGAPVYTTYIFGRGAIALGVAARDDTPLEGGFGTWNLEFGREPLSGNSIMINRRRFLLHIRGAKWLGGTLAGKSPTNAELEASNNWLRVFEQKHMRVVKVTHNIAA